MQFEVCTSRSSYENKEEVKKLEALGFIFDYDSECNYYHIEGQGKVELNSLQDYFDFIKIYGACILGAGRIEIYDAYRE